MAENEKQNCVKGTIHQGSQSLSALLRVRQCGLMAIAAALQNKSMLLQTWTGQVLCIEILQLYLVIRFAC